MTWLLTLALGLLGPIGITVIAVAVVAAVWFYAGARAAAVLGIVLVLIVVYLAGSKAAQDQSESKAASQRIAQLEASEKLAKEIAEADRLAATRNAEALAKAHTRLKELLNDPRPDSPCVSDDDARRLRDL